MLSEHTKLALDTARQSIVLLNGEKGIKVSYYSNIELKGEPFKVQVYITDNKASYPVPLKLLKAFKRIHFKAGEKKTFTFESKSDDFGLYDDDMRRIIEQGDFTVMVGGISSRAIDF